MRKTKERLYYRSVGLTTAWDDALADIAEKEGDSIAEHIRIAIKEYLTKKGYLKEEFTNVQRIF